MTTNPIYITAKVFLGGTCNGSAWRDKLIPMLKPYVGYFNPVVADWTPECQEEEIKQRRECAVRLYVITPKMTGFYSIAELVEDSVKYGSAIFCYLVEDENDWFTAHQLKSLQAIGRMTKNYTAIDPFTSLEDVADYLNKQLAPNT